MLNRLRQAAGGESAQCELFTRHVSVCTRGGTWFLSTSSSPSTSSNYLIQRENSEAELAVNQCVCFTLLELCLHLFPLVYFACLLTQPFPASMTSQPLVFNYLRLRANSAPTEKVHLLWFVSVWVDLLFPHHVEMNYS